MNKRDRLYLPYNMPEGELQLNRVFATDGYLSDKEPKSAVLIEMVRTFSSEQEWRDIGKNVITLGLTEETARKLIQDIQDALAHVHPKEEEPNPESLEIKKYNDWRNWETRWINEAK